MRGLDAHHLCRLAELEQLVGHRYLGWGRSEAGLVFVDVLEDGVLLEDVKPNGSGVDRFTGQTLHSAIGAALRAARGA
jgi:hypothetical protein